MLSRTRFLSAILAVGLLAITPASAQTATWTIDHDHSAAQFTVRHMVISNVSGSFTKVSGTVEFNEKDITQSQVSASIDVSSVDTRVAPRHADLRSDHFFDVQTYPTIDFKSRRIISKV